MTAKIKSSTYPLTLWSELLLDVGQLLGDEQQQGVHLPHPALEMKIRDEWEWGKLRDLLSICPGKHISSLVNMSIYF